MYIYSVVGFVNISSVSSLSSSFLSSSFTSPSATWIISQTIYSYAVTSPILQYYRQPWTCVCRYSHLEQNSYHVAAIDQLKYSMKRVDHHPFWHNFIKTCFTKAVNNSGFWNLTPEKNNHLHSFKHKDERYLFSIVNSSYHFLEDPSAAIALQRLNDTLIHRMQTPGCIWWMRVECDRFKILDIWMSGAVINNQCYLTFL